MPRSWATVLLVGNWIGDGIVAFLIGRLIESTSEPSPTRDAVVLFMWPLVVVAGTSIVLVWIWRATRPQEVVVAQADPGKKAKRETADLRRAVDTLITWVYREDNAGPGLSEDAVQREPAPQGYGQDMYRHLRLESEYNPKPPVEQRPVYEGARRAKERAEAAQKASQLDPMAPIYRHQKIHLADLVRDIHPPLIRNRTFENCEIIGPAFLHPRDSGIIEDIDLNISGVLTVMQVEPGQPLSGVIVASGCVFRGCGFHEIVLVGDDVLAAKLRAELKLPEPTQGPVVTHQAAPTHGTDVRCSCGWEGSITELEAHKKAAKEKPAAPRS